MSKEYCELINDLKPFEFKTYSGVSSREKLVVYAIKYLTDNNIPATFDYVCMAAFRFFPEEFKLSDEFPGQADIAGLNRTLMHLRPSERNFATGKPNTNYVLTEMGLAVAKQVEEGLINNVFASTATSSRHDNVVSRKNKEKYLNYIKKPLFGEYTASGDYSLDMIWRMFMVMPFSKLDTLLADVIEIKEIAKSENDEKCVELCTLMEKDLRKLIDAKRESEKVRK